MKNFMNKKRKGAFAFEYIIVLVLVFFVGVMSWRLIKPAASMRTHQISLSVSGCESDSSSRYCPSK